MGVYVCVHVHVHQRMSGPWGWRSRCYGCWELSSVCILFPTPYLFGFLETGSPCMAMADLKFMETHPFLPPQFWE